MVNSQNNCWPTLSPQDVLIVMKTECPVHIMILGVVTTDNNVMPPLIFPHAHRPNIEAYIKYLEEVVLPWIERLASGRPYTSGNRTLHHGTQAGVSSLGCDHITPSISLIATL